MAAAGLYFLLIIALIGVFTCTSTAETAVAAFSANKLIQDNGDIRDKTDLSKNAPIEGLVTRLESFMKDKLAESDSRIMEFIRAQKLELRKDLEMFVRSSLDNNLHEPFLKSIRGLAPLVADVIPTSAERTKLSSDGTNTNLGFLAGTINQDRFAVAVGWSAGYLDQGFNAVAVGESAGYKLQGENAVAIGHGAGASSQAESSVAVGNFAGFRGQNASATALGAEAGAYNQGQYALALGSNAGYSNQHANTIILNANSGINLNSEGTGRFYVKPIRGISDIEAQTSYSKVIRYIPSTGEIIYVMTSSVKPSLRPSVKPSLRPSTRPSSKPLLRPITNT